MREHISKWPYGRTLHDKWGVLIECPSLPECRRFSGGGQRSWNGLTRVPEKLVGCQLRSINSLHTIPYHTNFSHSASFSFSRYHLSGGRTDLITHLLADLGVMTPQAYKWPIRPIIHTSPKGETYAAVR